MYARFIESLRGIVGDDFAGKSYLLAVSGGADSSVMAFFFRAAGLEFSIAHCNFHLRGDFSDRDMEFVKNMAKNLEANFFVKEFDTYAEQKNSGKSIEMVARELRYEWFSLISGDFDFVVTAHNCNDMAETTLLNMTRGAALRGLCSIPLKNDKIIRPMTEFTAEEIRNYAKYHNICYVEDHTNSDQTIIRNRIRHSVVPVLETINPNFLKTYEHNLKILQRQYAFYKSKITSEITKITTQNNETIIIDKDKLTSTDDSQLILYEILTKYNFSEDTVNRLCFENIPSGRQFYSATYKLVVERESYVVTRLGLEENSLTINILSLEDLKDHFIVEEKVEDGNIVFEKNSDILYIPKEKLKFPLQIRGWQDGDYFYPLGMKGRKKLSDFFNNAKIENHEKRKIQLLCHEDQIIWVIGYRSDERFKVVKEKNYYKITVKQ